MKRRSSTVHIPKSKHPGKLSEGDVVVNSFSQPMDGVSVLVPKVSAVELTDDLLIPITLETQ